eukprot:14777587-Alexandrium_andersonii.AAC.1
MAVPDHASSAPTPGLPEKRPGGARCVIQGLSCLTRALAYVRYTVLSSNSPLKSEGESEPSG